MNKETSDNKDWVDIKVDINDGWADDVTLIYPENGWSPDKEELTRLDIDTSSSVPVKENETAFATDNEKAPDTDTREEKIKKLIHSDNTIIKSKKKNGFTIFMIIWSAVLVISLCVFLKCFYSFLGKYQAAYEASRPALFMDELVGSTNASDGTTIYNMMTGVPPINEFETEDNVAGYISALLEGKQISYKEADSYTEEIPAYQLTADGYIIGDITLRKDATKTAEYSFPIWYMSEFNFYTSPEYSARVELPDNYTLLINGIAVSDDYFYEKGEPLPIEDIYLGYAITPKLKKYYCNGFYEEPVLSAVDCFGNECEVVFNTERSIYEVPFTVSNEAAELKEYCRKVVSDYAMYISGDAPGDILDGYFFEGSPLLDMIKEGTSRQYFTKHTDATITDIKVEQFEMFSPEIMHCKVTLNQNMKVWGKDAVVPVHGDFYYVDKGDGFKVIYISY